MRKRRIAAVRGPRANARESAEEVAAEDGSEEGVKTPTAVESGGRVDDDDDGNEEFEKRYREAEKALQERLEKLSLKLGEQDDTIKEAETSIASAGS